MAARQDATATGELGMAAWQDAMATVGCGFARFAIVTRE